MISANVPKPGTASTLVGAARREFRMQIGRRSTWIVTALLAAILLISAVPHWDPANTLAADMGIYALLFNILVPVVIGSLLADRVVRDSRLGLEELFDSLPASRASRLLGKYAGTVAASLLPLAAVWTIALIRPAIDQGWTAIPLGLAGFAAIEVPAVLFVAAFALACPTVLGAPLFRVLFVGYWFWGNLVTANVMPTLSSTWLTPLGDHARVAFFGGGAFASAQSYAGAHQSIAAGVGSIAVLIVVAALVMTALVANQTRLSAAR